MPSLLVQMPDAGLNGLVPANMLDPRAAAKGSQNMLYQNGLAETPFGFAKVDMTTVLLDADGNPDIVLGIFPFRELDGYTHVIAVTTDKIYDHDRVNEEWDDKTQSGVTMSSNITNPVSYVEIAHTATETTYDDDATKGTVGYHLVVCDGGLSNIQRWAGRYEADFGNLTGGGGYHGGTTHKALQVGSFQSRLILLSPQDYNATTATWAENPQRVRWPMSGYLQTWTGTGSGFYDLIDTGGHNVWSAQLGSDYIIYQTRGIWGLNYVGGTDVFRPQVYVPDLGLLSYHLLVAKNNIHYFIGTDYNVYQYFGGTVLQKIGNPIHKYLQDDLEAAYQYRCWMVMGQENKWLWIFIVPTDQTYITKAYGRNMVTGKWTVRDFAHLFGTGEGITAVNLIGSESYTIGDTYQDGLDAVSVYDADASTDTIGDVTIRYGDFLIDTSRTLTKDYTSGSWSAGGLDYSLNAEAFTVDFTENDILVTFDGSDAANVAYGQHYYTVYDVSTNGFSIKPTCTTATGDLTGEHGIADASDTTPADLSVDSNLTVSFYSACSFDSPGETYNQQLEDVLVGDRLMIGDATGIIRQFDDTIKTDDGALMDCRHLTPVFDWGEPDRFKRWPGLSVVAEGTTGGAMQVGYRISSFDSSDTGWADFTFDLNDDFIEKTFWFNKTSKKIQCRLRDFSGLKFGIREFKILEPLLEENR